MLSLFSGPVCALQLATQFSSRIRLKEEHFGCIRKRVRAAASSPARSWRITPSALGEGRQWTVDGIAIVTESQTCSISFLAALSWRRIHPQEYPGYAEGR